MAKSPKKGPLNKQSPKKKLGRPPKVLAWVHRLGDSQSEWNKWFRSAGHPQEIERWGKPDERIEMFLQDSLPVRHRDIHGRKTRPMKNKFGESADHGSITQPDDALMSLRQELAENEKVPLPENWQLYLEYMEVIVEEIRSKNRRAALKKLILEDARSRYWENPPDLASLGTPGDFRARCAESHVEVRLQCDRRKHVIRFTLYSLPPDEPEDLDEPEGPGREFV